MYRYMPSTSSCSILFQYAVFVCHIVYTLFTAAFNLTNAQCWYFRIKKNQQLSSFMLPSYPLRPCVDSHRILLLINISNARRAFYIWKVAVLDSQVWRRTRRTCAGGFFWSVYLEPSSLRATATEQPSLCVKAQLRWKCSTVWDKLPAFHWV